MNGVTVQDIRVECGEWRVESAECRVNERTADAVQDIVFLRPL